MRSHCYHFNHPTRHRWLRGALWTGAAAALASAGAAVYRWPDQVHAALVTVGFAREQTVEGAVRDYSDKAKKRFEPACLAKKISWPPARVRLLAFKRERVLEVWVAGKRGAFTKAAQYPILAASGGPGPKRRAGDCQVPEGFYKLPVLNPNSKFHLSLRVDYPNAEDLAHRPEDRPDPGTDIYVHGGANSIGCIAIGDDAIEELFTLVAQVPASGREIWIAPVDLRKEPGFSPQGTDAWVAELYGKLAARIRAELP
jgi:hypothetical protein